MGNHESPCIVCGENVLTGFNYDCEERHNKAQIRAEIKRVRELHLHRGDGTIRDWVLRDIARLEALLPKARN